MQRADSSAPAKASLPGTLNHQDMSHWPSLLSALISDFLGKLLSRQTRLEWAIQREEELYFSTPLSHTVSLIYSSTQTVLLLEGREYENYSGLKKCKAKRGQSNSSWTFALGCPTRICYSSKPECLRPLLLTALVGNRHSGGVGLESQSKLRVSCLWGEHHHLSIISNGNFLV